MSQAAFAYILFVQVALFVGVLFLIAFLAYQKDLERRHVAFIAVGCFLVAFIAIIFGPERLFTPDHDVLARKIAEEIRVAPIKVDGQVSIDTSALARVIAKEIRTLPGITPPSDAPRPDAQDLASEIARHLGSLDVRRSGSEASLLHLLSMPQMFLLGLALFFYSIVRSSRTRETEKQPKPWWKDPMGIIGILVAVAGIVVPLLWPEPAIPVRLYIDTNLQGKTQTLFEASMASPICFSPGEDRASPEAVCKARQTLTAAGSRIAIVVGSHDIQELGQGAKQKHSSNEALARKRAESVRQLLSENKIPACSVGSFDAMLVLTTAPFRVGEEANQTDLRKQDRIVRVYGIGSPPKNALAARQCE